MLSRKRMNESNDYQQYLHAETQLNQGLIRTAISMDRPEGYIKDPRRRMDTMSAFLDLCQNPQKGIPAIHVTGTSGKGSVCARIAGILRTAGLSVGLHTSPYLQSATEKIWIDDTYIQPREFVDLVNWIMPIASPWVSPETPASPHGMASVSIAFEAFRRRDVDVMVFEAGCGGRFDLTSFVDTRVSVVTNVGLDHVVSLGPTIEDIAWHKAGIARRGRPFITGASGSALRIIERETRALDCPLTVIPPHPENDVQSHNDSIAILAAKELCRQMGRSLSEETIAMGIHRVNLPGRLEMITNADSKIVLDGAHNQDKLTAAVSNCLTGPSPKPHVALVGLLGTKADRKTVSPIINRFDDIVVTEPRVYGKQSCPARTTAALFSNCPAELHDGGPPHHALETALRLAKGGTLLITGSFYLCGELRETWYPKRDVVLQRTSWPR